MWKLDHKCNISDPDTANYASVKTEYGGMKLTRMFCPTCREELYLVGHEPFDAAVGVKPAGFAILATHKADA